MATYLKRASKLFDISRPQASAEINLRDLMCPVCRGILIEPVTLPCSHNLCLRCLKGYAPKILSVPGEIRREYEMQLQIAEVEMRRRRESERIANEELIRKIHEDEEKEKLVQLAQDRLLAKTLAKKQLLEKEKNVKYYESLKSPSLISNSNDYLNQDGNNLMNSMINDAKMDGSSLLYGRDANLVLDMKQTEPRKSNLNLLSKIQAERLALGVKSSILNKSKDAIKLCFDYSAPCHNFVTRKHQSVAMLTNKSSFNYISEPSCSNSKIYGDQNEEELRVPSDVLNTSSNKKNLGIGICVQSQMTTGLNDDKRIGSAQSAGSHDSINPEIHHFKPIRAMPRTPLKLSQDGRQIDPKLLRVVPILKRISNPTLKPPSQHVKRIIGCSWSAFKEYIVTGRVRQNEIAECSKANWKSPGNPIQNHYQFTKIQARPQASETARKLDLVPDVSFDTNKNYTKNINRILNGTKVSKKLILDDNDKDDDIEIIMEPLKPNKSKGQIKNGLLGKRKQKNLSRSIFNDDEVQNAPSCCSTFVEKTPVIVNKIIEERRIEEDEFGAVENIAERIKRRKVAMETFKKSEVTSEMKKKSTRSKTLNKRGGDNPVEVQEDENSESKEQEEESDEELELPSKSRRKGIKTKGTRQRNNKNIKSKVTIELDSADKTNQKRNKMDNRATRNSVRLKTNSDNNEELNNKNVVGIDEIIDADLDERVLQDQERIERLVMQEKKDYELAQRLQAQFNEMERISGRTRGSRRALERNEIVINNSDNDKTTKINGKSSSNNSINIATNAVKSRRRQRCD
ncbi:hypothetical protein PV328_005247 [Microctonus aethiopoides]|uniref:RING-type E3 ubiquitin transferase n=1 Tax=Microctonus aethiopoides TaxID=144406 RepID=A0AA39KS69_9HYME|nr:hypothetical protein PV328_005247 [Microctonus aethiopoides]